MSTLKRVRATVYLDAEVDKALRMRAAASDRSISAMVNESVRASLDEDAMDLAAFNKRKREHSVSFDSLDQGMKLQGLLHRKG
jgi:plasmid stability protein